MQFDVDMQNTALSGGFVVYGKASSVQPYIQIYIVFTKEFDPFHFA